MNFAGLKKLPLVFVCENNLYSTHLPVNEIRVNSKISEIAKPFQIDTFTANGNDVLEVYELAKKAIETCRMNNGPVFLEFLTYRLRGHVGPNDIIQGTKTDIRPKSERDDWSKNDPIENFKKYLIDNSFLTFEDISEIESLCEIEVNDANAFAANSCEPNKKELGKYVFKE